MLKPTDGPRSIELLRRLDLRLVGDGLGSIERGVLTRKIIDSDLPVEGAIDVLANYLTF